MAQMQHDSPKKNRLIGAIEAGRSVSSAADYAGIPRSTASDIWWKYQSTGSTHNKPHNGCPKKLTHRTKQELVRRAQPGYQHLNSSAVFGSSWVPLEGCEEGAILEGGAEEEENGLGRGAERIRHVKSDLVGRVLHLP
ncbi:hypothetical protein BT96DRAFT_989495 [Gymnopus androsaceus JB14]|uniref:Uncharacterized protein n=1 Tax=Gymnopus androsaceus JB14 TaxID=1447944 RepID=A0A6A4I2N3_9AGAR|nr:hypothetical protein BT96DRAFT_989495 [Gymnopus androsaceus JB14]